MSSCGYADYRKSKLVIINCRSEIVSNEWHFSKSCCCCGSLPLLCSIRRVNERMGNFRKLLIFLHKMPLQLPPTIHTDYLLLVITCSSCL